MSDPPPEMFMWILEQLKKEVEALSAEWMSTETHDAKRAVARRFWEAVTLHNKLYGLAVRWEELYMPRP